MNQESYEFTLDIRANIPSPLIKSLFRERKRMFVDNLKWTTSKSPDYESDEFDRSDTIYAIVHQGDTHVCSLRLNRGPIDKLLIGKFTKHNGDKDGMEWEISRFFTNDISASPSTMLLLYQVFRFVVTKSVGRILATVDRRTLRYLRMMSVVCDESCEHPSGDRSILNIEIDTSLVSFLAFEKELIFKRLIKPSNREVINRNNISEYSKVVSELVNRKYKHAG